jgi:hypothetical protein
LVLVFETQFWQKSEINCINYWYKYRDYFDLLNKTITLNLKMEIITNYKTKLNMKNWNKEFRKLVFPGTTCVGYTSVIKGDKVIETFKRKSLFGVFQQFLFSYIVHRHLGPGYVFSSILSIKCASTTYMNPFDMLRCEINAFMNYAPYS